MMDADDRRKLAKWMYRVLWLWENPSKAKEYKDKARRTGKAAISARAYRQRNAEQVRKAKREWAARNPALKREMDRRYRATHKAQVRANRRAWKKTAPGKLCDKRYKARVIQEMRPHYLANVLNTRAPTSELVDLKRLHLAEKRVILNFTKGEKA